jgi:prepilin-type N-terminal cleavage/methylation domain-containing protein
MTLRRRLAQGEEGFTLVELSAAMVVLTIGFFALAGALGLGFKQIALGRQRQTATEIGNARIEHLRNVPYDSVALSSQPVHSDDEDDPDQFVNETGQFDYSGNGDYEDLIVDDVGGQVLHLEDPVGVGQTIMSVYQYVTWADQANDIKRVTVVIVYKPAALPGAAKVVRVSSFFTPGTVTVDGSAPEASQGSSSPTPSPIPTDSSGCSGLGEPPSGDFSIVSITGSDTGYTGSETVSLSMAFTDSCDLITVQFSNDGTNYGSQITYDASNPTVAWTLVTGQGTRSVWAKVYDGLGNMATVGPRSVVLDTLPPTVPGTLSATISCSGSDRSVHLTWGSSTDTNFNGYRIYQSINSAPWTPLGTSSTSVFNDSHKKGLDSVRYYVVGYDHAGNESNATNTKSISKNQCS